VAFSGRQELQPGSEEGQAHLDHPAAHVIRGGNARLRLCWPHVVAFAAVYGNRFLDSAELRRVALDKVFVAMAGDGCENNPEVSSYGDWYRFISDCASSPIRVIIDDCLEINLDKACNDVRTRMDLYAYGLSRVEEKDSVLGGAAVFRDTRISVHHIGKMAERGVSIKEILEDYSSLTENDVEFAKLYYRARPSVGRPRGTDEHAEIGTE
jgi:uncharacterized protein (DUF433 family)